MAKTPGVEKPKLMATGTVRSAATGRPLARFAAVPKADTKDRGKVGMAAMRETLAKADKRYKAKEKK